MLYDMKLEWSRDQESCKVRHCMNYYENRIFGMDYRLEQKFSVEHISHKYLELLTTHKKKNIHIIIAAEITS